MKNYLPLVEKYEALSADETLSEEHRAYAAQALRSIKSGIASEFSGSGWDELSFKKISQSQVLTDYLGLKALGLTGIASKNSGEILQAFDHAIELLRQKGSDINRELDGKLGEIEVVNIYGDDSTAKENSRLRLEFECTRNLEGFEAFGHNPFEAFHWEDVSFLEQFTIGSAPSGIQLDIRI